MKTTTERIGPTCIGFIMDGNRRWAKERGLPTLEGHQKGFEAFQNIIRAVRDAEVDHAIFYAFSTENWERSEEEVSYLMQLFREGLKELQGDIEEEKVRVRFVGDRSHLPQELVTQMETLEEKSTPYQNTTIWVALSYGGRAEIVDAVNRAIAEKEPVTEATFSKFFWTAQMPDPDIIVRTSGEQRLSNFLPWQAVYSEFFFVDTYWPDFGKDEFQGILEAYGERKRRKGK